MYTMPHSVEDINSQTCIYYKDVNLSILCFVTLLFIPPFYDASTSVADSKILTKYSMV